MYDKQLVQKLAIAIIKQTITDYKYGTAEEHRMAKRFLDSNALEYWLSITGISAEAIRNKITKQYVS
jgi:predicted HD phosphohydrolase